MTSIPPASSAQLHRGLSRVDVLALTLNNVIGAGIFALPATVAAAAGGSTLVVLLAAFVLIALMALCTVEVASRFDVTGGPMRYAASAFGPRAGFVVGWLMFLSRLAAFGAIATIMLDYARGVWAPLGDPWARAALLSAFVAALAALNLRGVVQGARASHVLMLAKGVPLVGLALAGVWLAGWNALPEGESRELASLSDALLLAFFACMGFEQAAVVAGEVREPRRDLPVGILGGLAIVGVLYALLMLACFATVPDLASSKRPLADAAAALLGPAGAIAMSLTAVFSCAGGLSVSLLVSPRALFALAEQGDLPRALARIEPVHRTPAFAIVVTAVLVWALTVSGTFTYLATFSVIARMLMYASTCAALIPLRRRDGPAPVRIPFAPLWAVIALASCLLALASTTGAAVRDVSIAVALGLALRWLVRRAG